MATPFRNPLLSKPSHPLPSWSGLRSFPLPPSPLPKPPTLSPSPFKPISNLLNNSNPFPLFHNPSRPRPSIPAPSAGRSKKKPGGPSPGRIEGNAELRRAAKQNARRRSRRLAENLFYRRNKASQNNADSFTDDELRMIGLGYDRFVRFLPSPDDPNLRHPHDWYKYGQYGPYSWRGVVVGPPIRGRFSDERVSLIEEVRTHEEWEEIEQFEMSSDFSRRIKELEGSKIGLRHYWVFVRHPRWRASELPWQQWTLVAEVVLEAGENQRLDKWSLMGRLGNTTRAMVTQCAAWMRPDIIYVKKPVYQCRFEPQEDFFRLLGPLLDPETENEYLCELRSEDGGRVESCTYFGGLCKIVRISPKSYVDDVVKAYMKLSEGGKSRCLEFLLTNHPMELLHPYTKEWKVKLEEMELGCDAPDESEDEGDTSLVDWMEEDEGNDDVDEGEEEDEEVIDIGEDADSSEGEVNPEETEEYWKQQWERAVKSSEAMESLVKKSVERSTKFYKKQMMEEQQRMEEQERMEAREEGNVVTVDDMNWEQNREDVQTEENRGPRRRVKKGKIPPELFLRAAVRPFTYRNLVKEIVLMRHAIVDGDIKDFVRADCGGCVHCRC